MEIQTCSICCVKARLTKEHIPPKRAFNDSTVLLRKIDVEKSKAGVRWKTEEKKGGNFRLALCDRCNNKTGHLYGAEYVRFVKECANFATQQNANKTLSITIGKLRPLCILKQVLVIMCASSGPGLVESHPALRLLILNKHAREMPDPLRLYAYLRTSSGGRSSGIAGYHNLENGNIKVLAEFSWWPVGWILTLENYPGIDALDITHWRQFSYKEKQTLTLNLPCKWAVTPYPMDFRTPEEIQRDIEQSYRQVT